MHWRDSKFLDSGKQLLTAVNCHPRRRGGAYLVQPLGGRDLVRYEIHEFVAVCRETHASLRQVILNRRQAHGLFVGRGIHEIHSVTVCERQDGTLAKREQSLSMYLKQGRDSDSDGIPDWWERVHGLDEQADSGATARSCLL